jgi:hypothetical protein
MRSDVVPVQNVVRCGVQFGEPSIEIGLLSLCQIDIFARFDNPIPDGLNQRDALVDRPAVDLAHNRRQIHGPFATFP